MQMLKELLFDSGESQYEWIKDKNGNIIKVLKQEFKVNKEKLEDVKLDGN